MKITVVSHGWHTGLVLRADDFPPDFFPERVNFREARYYEFGWGDRSYYRYFSPSLTDAVEAALFSEGSVLHVAAFSTEPDTFFANSEMAVIDLSTDGYGKLLKFIDSTFERPSGNASPSLGAGWYGNSLFFAARGDFSLSYTCNSWVADALRQSACLFTSRLPRRASSVMKEIRER